MPPKHDLAIIAVLSSLLLVAFIMPVTCEEKPVIIATTTVLGSVVQDLAGDSVELHVVVSPAICPAHYDVKPSDVYVFSKASVILYHGFEPWITGLYEASGSKAKLVKISGSWSTPDGIKKYYQEVASALREELGLDVSDKLKETLEKIDSVAGEIRSRADKLGVSDVKVITMKWQEEFVKWVGFNVAADFGPPEKLSSADVDKLVEIGKNERVTLVISNLQSGTKFGESLAAEIGAVHVVLSNFPWSDPEAKTLMDLMKRNADELFKATELYDVKVTALELQRMLELYQTLTYCLIALVIVEAALLVYLIRRIRS